MAMNLSRYLTLTRAVCNEPNLTGRFSPEDLGKIGERVWQGYEQDRQSRAEWEKRNTEGMSLAMQLREPKNWPWPKCANVAFPLVTIAAMQFHSRAYPALIYGPEIVKCRVMGDDPQGLLAERAERVSDHMSYQLLEGDQDWEEEADRGLLNLAIVGCNFRKTYYSSSYGRNESELVLAQDLVVDYWAKGGIETVRRKTHILYLHRNDLHERIQRGAFRDISEESWYTSPPAQLSPSFSEASRDQRQGVHPPMPDSSTPFRCLEQHVWMDLDCDGYEEPYIITIEETSREVLRIVTRFRWQDIEMDRGKVVKIRAEEYFTKYEFIPAPDDGFYGIGFGVFLGPLNEQVNTLINQLLDAGTMATTAGGFLGRGVKLRGGVYTFQPMEWKRLDSTGEDIAKNVYPLPIREPSAVLLQLLDLLINYTNRIAGVTDTQIGENPGQNTPASNMNAMLEQGQKIYNAIYKRVWRAMKAEFRKLYILNGINMPPSLSYGEGGLKKISREDYLGDPGDIVPVADPNLTTEVQKLQQATLIKQSAAGTPGYNQDEVERNWLRAMKVDGWAKLYLGSQKVPAAPHPKVQAEQEKTKRTGMELQAKQIQFLQGLQVEQAESQARIRKTEAEILEIIECIGAEKAKHLLNAFNAMLVAEKQRDESIRKQIELLMKGVLENGNTGNESGGMAPMAGPAGDTGLQEDAGEAGPASDGVMV